MVFSNAYSPTFTDVDKSTQLLVHRMSKPEPERLENTREGKNVKFVLFQSIKEYMFFEALFCALT